MRSVKVQCPAKINLNLKVINKRPDGFHNIESVMQTISLYDYLTISVIESEKLEITLRGNSKDIPYNNDNIVYKAVELFTKEKSIKNQKILIYIEKNIPISAGLAGGSTDAAGTLFGLNELFDRPATFRDINQYCANLGSDLNVCLNGGCLKTSGRGEIIEPQQFIEYDVSLIKPLTLGISAKEAYKKFSKKISEKNNIEKRKEFINDLEWAIIDDYNELQTIKSKYSTAVMTGSGSTFFSLEEDFEPQEGYWVKNGLLTIPDGVKLI